MSADHPTPRLWKWVQMPTFEPLDHPEWDLIQWDLEDELTLGPRKVGFSIFDERDDWWYLSTKDAPGLEHMPAMIVLFRIASEPTPDDVGIIEGHAVWRDDNLIEALMREVRLCQPSS